MNWKDITGESILEGDLTELFDGKGSYEWSTHNTEFWEGEFTVNGVPFSVNMEKLKSSGVWDVEFSMESGHRNAEGKRDRFGTTGTSGTSSVQVFSVILGMMREWLNHMKPEAFGFTGDKSNGKESLYGKIVNKMTPVLKQMGYTTEVVPGEGKSTFMFRKAKPQRGTTEAYEDVVETATAGGTSAGNFPSFASAGGLGAGFDPNGDHGIYQKDRRKRGKLPNIVRRANP